MTSAIVRYVPNYIIRDLPPFASAMVTAEFLFKFGSFTVECLAFLALWWGLAQLYRRIMVWLRYRPRNTAQPWR